MLGDNVYKEILLNRYENKRATAENQRDRGNNGEAAATLREAADVLEDVANEEDSESMARKRRELAENHRNAAEKLEEAAESSGQEHVSADGSTQSQPRDSEPSYGGEHEDDLDSAQYLEEPPDVTFDDVGGMDELKGTFRDKVIKRLEDADHYSKYGLTVTGGVLLYGPPGTGKTYITQALAGELDYNYMPLTAADLTSSLVGEAAKNVRDVFEVARRNQPCVLFIDEIDAIVPSRKGQTDLSQSEKQMVDQFLEETSDIKDEDVVLVGATNHRDQVDTAARSRFPEEIEVPPPDTPARVAVLRVQLRDRPSDLQTVDWGRIGRRTEGFSARDLEFVAEDAAELAADQAKERGEEIPIAEPHIERAIANRERSFD